MNASPSDAQSAFVESMGRYWEGAGSTRVMGAIVGWLMVCEPAHQSASDLVSALRVSTGSVSTQVRALVNYGLAETVTFRGDRTRYYQIREGAWLAFMRAEQVRMDALSTLAAAGTRLLPATRPERVTSLADVASVLNEEWPRIMARLEDKRTSSAPFFEAES